jgi:uncharacterized protein (TIGR00730 family)
LTRRARARNKPAVREIRNICLYCGAAEGDDPRYLAAAGAFGRMLAEAGVGLVYGGAECGLMGAAARAALAAGGRVIGVLPDFFNDREVAAQGLSELVVVPDMHARKMTMFDRADAFVALPGGVGTLEELAEQLTWIQLGRHDKPLVIADIGGFWRPLLTLLAHMRSADFIRAPYEVRYMVAERVEDILPMIFAAAARPGEPHGADGMAIFRPSAEFERGDGVD